MAIIDTCVLLCGLAFPDSYSGRLLKNVSSKKAKAIISNFIETEAINVASKRAGYLLPKVKEYIDLLKSRGDFIVLKEQEISKFIFSTKDRSDDHVIAAAILSKDNTIYTIDKENFCDPEMYKIERQFNLSVKFPDVPIEDLVENAHDYKPEINQYCGTVTLEISVDFPSIAIADRPQKHMFIDAEGLFGLWYEGDKQSFCFAPYRLEKRKWEYIRRPFKAHQHIRVTIAYDSEIGYSFYFDRLKAKNYKIKWRLALDKSYISIGSSPNGENHIGSCLIHALRFFGNYLSKNRVNAMHEFGIISFSDNDLDFTHGKGKDLQDFQSPLYKVLFE